MPQRSFTAMQAKYRGALLGVAVGDALGAPFEGAGGVGRWELEELRHTSATLRYTDDTHMTIGMAQSLIERNAFDGKHLAETFARNFRAEPWRGYGAGPPQVFRKIEQGVPWDQAGRQLFGGSGSFGNGAAMRVAPTALFASHDLDQVAEIARQSAVITHTHELGIEGAVLQACTIAWLLANPPGGNLDRQQILGVLRSSIRSDVFRERLDQVEALLPDASDEQVVSILGNGIEAACSVPTALYLFLRSPESFSDVVLDAIRLGGDTDTIASMAGALSGAFLGDAAIPAVWREHVEGAETLQKLADDLFACHVRHVG